MYPLALLEEQGMGTAYEYYSKLRVMQATFARFGYPRNMVVLGLPEKHGYDLDFVLAAHQLRSAGVLGPLTVCDDRSEVLEALAQTLEALPDREMGAEVQLVQLESLTDWHAVGRSLASVRQQRPIDWLVSTAAVQRLTDDEIAIYLQNARQTASFALLFIPNSGNRAHLTLSGLRGLELDQVVALCDQLEPSVPIERIVSGYCDIPPFPPGLQRSSEAKENALNSPIESAAMWGLEWWCRAERWMPRAVQRRWAHLVYVALDLSEGSE
jgi:hypothetical protein